jgi:hypothetical protein
MDPTIEPRHAAREPGPQALLLLGICLAALWIGTNLVFPALAPTAIPSAVTRLAIHGVILFGIWRGIVRADIPPARRLLVWLAIAVPFSLWLAVIWQAAISGAFQLAPGVPRLPRLPLAITLPFMIGLPPLLLSRTVAMVLDAIPAPWLVALQVYRVFGGIILVNWAHGAVSGYFAWPAGIGDVITGVMALPAALAVASGTAQGRRAALLWNIFGLLDFAGAITMGLLSAPGPLQRVGFEISASLAGTYPTVMIPAFVVPSSILLHALSIRQLLRRNGRLQTSAEAATEVPPRLNRPRGR